MTPNNYLDAPLNGDLPQDYTDDNVGRILCHNLHAMRRLSMRGRRVGPTRIIRVARGRTAVTTDAPSAETWTSRFRPLLFFSFGRMIQAVAFFLELEHEQIGSH